MYPSHNTNPSLCPSLTIVKYDIPSSHVEFGLKMVLLIEIMFASACTFTKLSMLMLVRRMLTSATIFWRRVTLGAICIVGLQGALFCIVLVFQCRLVKIIAFSYV